MNDHFCGPYFSTRVFISISSSSVQGLFLKTVNSYVDIGLSSRFISSCMLVDLRGVFLSIDFKLWKQRSYLVYMNFIIIKLVTTHQQLLNSKICPMTSSPLCHYHPTQKITYFCLNQCTLPLCDLCLIQHRKQDKSSDCNKKITTYDKAQKFALEVLQTQKSTAVQNIKKFDNKFQNFKTDVMSTVQKLLNILEEKTKQATCHFQTNIKNVTQKIHNIKANDIKQIILVYLNIEKAPQPDWTITYQLDQQIISKQLQQFLNVSKENKSTANQLKKHLKVVESMSEIYMVSSNLSEIKQNVSVRLEQNKSSQLLKPEKKRHRGIFVASSPKSRDDVLSYSCNPKQTLKQSLEIDTRMQMNSSMQLAREPKKIEIQPDLINSRGIQGDLNISNSRYSQRRPATTTSKYSNNLTNFGFPEKVIILKESTSRKRLEVKTPMSTDRQREKVKERESEKKRKEIDSVINRSDMASNSSSSRLIIKKNRVYQECLNPQEMRQLLLKKNTLRGKQMGGSKILSDKLNLQPGVLRVQNH